MVCFRYILVCVREQSAWMELCRKKQRAWKESLSECWQCIIPDGRLLKTAINSPLTLWCQWGMASLLDAALWVKPRVVNLPLVTVDPNEATVLHRGVFFNEKCKTFTFMNVLMLLSGGWITLVWRPSVFSQTLTDAELLPTIRYQSPIMMCNVTDLNLPSRTWKVIKVGQWKRSAG